MVAPNTTTQRRKVVIPTGYYLPAYLGGGPIQTLKALIEESPEGFDTRVICANHDLGESDPLVDRPNEWHPVGRAEVRYVGGGWKDLLAAFRSTSDADLIYLNSLFDPSYSILPLLLRTGRWWKSAYVLIAPRGELYPGALAQKATKKRIFLKAFRTLGLTNRVTWHASTKDEAVQIREHFGDNQRIVIRENETPLPREATQRGARPDGPLRVFFASRLHPKKGLDILMEALAGVTQPVEVQIVGAFADEEYERRIMDLVGQLPSNVTVHFSGGLPREEVLAKAREADLMAFPTTGENFGHVIAEALSEACPVMCSEHTPWVETLRGGGGAVITPNTPEAWTEALEEYAQRGPEAWSEAIDDAARAYGAWRNEPKGQHVFEMVELAGATA